ncbi:MAG TPA: exodeoxyribonuclease VII large subunit [Chitinophagaceae bacterium]|nr:exodeoxyribonuclease VII large subunit [Chitinophagaceae bacterium]
MPIQSIPLSYLVEQIQATIEDSFEGQSYWVSARIMNVKKYPANRRCYLTLEEYENKEKKAEMRSVFWATAYPQIEKFERSTGQPFRDGIEITCRVKVRFHAVYGLNLDIYEIDIAHTLGQLELERQQTLDRLLNENSEYIQLVEGVYHSYNNRLPLPAVIQHIALITAPGSDGQRDFLQELARNRHGYSFVVTEFLTTIQGEQASRLIAEQLTLIRTSPQRFDAVAIVRGGGAQTDFKCFDDYALCRAIASFPVPVFTGIGHDRNQSIADLMAREQKTPTKVASLFVDHNNSFENKLMAARERMLKAVQRRLTAAANQLQQAQRIVKLASPEAILRRGFAIIRINGKIVTDPAAIHPQDSMETQLQNEMIESIVTHKRNDNNPYNL